MYDGALRDVEGLKEFGGFTSFFSSYDPSYHNPGGGQNRDLTTMIVGINRPTRIRRRAKKFGATVEFVCFK